MNFDDLRLPEGWMLLPLLLWANRNSVAARHTHEIAETLRAGRFLISSRVYYYLWPPLESGIEPGKCAGSNQEMLHLLIMRIDYSK